MRGRAREPVRAVRVVLAEERPAGRRRRGARVAYGVTLTALDGSEAAVFVGNPMLCGFAAV